MDEVQNPNPVAPEVSQAAPQPVTPVSAPKPESTQKKSHKMMFVFAGIIIVAVIVLGTAGYFYYKNNMQEVPVTYSTPAVSPEPSITPTPTPISEVQNASDLDKVSGELNSTSDSDLQNDLDQATTEGNSL